MATQEIINSYADRIINILLAAHTEESDKAAAPLAALLCEHGNVIASKGSFGQDYTGLVAWEGVNWLVESNNGWTRIYDPSDASYDYKADLGIENDE